MAEALAKTIRASTTTDEFDLGGYGVTQVRDLVQLAFVEPIQVNEMIRITLVVGGGKKVRQKYSDSLPLELGQALQNIGYTEDRGASCVLDCQGTYKYQHDTDKDLKFIHVFPRVDTSAAEANSSAEAAAAAEAGRAANPEWSCLTAGLDHFKKLSEKKVTSFQQKQTLLRLLKGKAAAIVGFEERIANRGTLTAEEQNLYDNAVDLAEKARGEERRQKATWLAAQMEVMVVRCATPHSSQDHIASKSTAGELTAAERESCLEQFSSKLAEIDAQVIEAVKEGKEAKAKKMEAAKEAIAQKRDALSACKPITVKVKFAKELKQLKGKIADLAKIEQCRQLQSLDTLKKLREKPELEQLVKDIEDANRGWFEDEEVFQRKMKLAVAAAGGGAKAAGGGSGGGGAAGGSSAGGFVAAKAGGARPKVGAKPAASSNPWAALSADD